MFSRAALAIIAALALALAGAVLWGSLERSGRLSAIAQRDACHAASAGAVKAQEALRAQERTDNERKADAANQSYRARLDQARALSAAYVESNRVQSQADRSTAATIDQAGDAAVPKSLPTGEPVMVDGADVQRAADWQAFGLACRDWALSVAQ